MGELVEKLWAYVGTFRDNITLYASHPSVLASEAADAIEDLTAEVTALRAKLAQYEKALFGCTALMEECPHIPGEDAWRERLLQHAKQVDADFSLIRKPEVSP